MANPGQFRKGQSGNPTGKAPGARNKITLALDALMDGQAEAITQKAIEMAIAGDTVAMRMCLDRIAPVRRDRPVTFALPAVESMSDLTKATGALLAALAAGEITPSEAAEIGKVIDAHVRAVEVTDIAERLARIEAGQP